MLNVVVFKWGQKYTSAHVNILKNSVKRHMKVPHNFVCFTDDSTGLDEEIIIRPVYSDSKTEKKQFRKLQLYRQDILQSLDFNVLLLDLDTVITNDITFLGELNENTIWRSKSNSPRGFVYNTSIVRVVDGRFIEYWNQFNKNPKKIINLARKDKWYGTDQSVLSYFVQNNINTVSIEDGVYSLRDDILVFLNESKTVPDEVKLISFYGDFDPADKELQRQYPWIETYWLSLASKNDVAILNGFIPTIENNFSNQHSITREELLEKQRHLILQQKRLDRELKQVNKLLSLR
jgi:hypothetical protein